jgi:hypothetical protein
MHGHAVVPQHYKGYDSLGKWVQSQRKNYKKMRKGSQSSMTPEKAFKLAEIGFVWDAMYKIRKREAPDDSDEEASTPRACARKVQRRGNDYDTSDSEDEEPPAQHFW